VGSRTTGIAEIVRDGRDGLLFEPGNAAQLAGCILTMLNGEALRRRMGEAAKARFLEAFELEKVTTGVAAFLSGL
jgi:glycosyltransferase involved in cell wall biosynthesis